MKRRIRALIYIDTVWVYVQICCFIIASFLHFDCYYSGRVIMAYSRTSKEAQLRIISAIVCIFIYVSPCAKT